MLNFSGCKYTNSFLTGKRLHKIFFKWDKKNMIVCSTDYSQFR